MRRKDGAEGQGEERRRWDLLLRRWGEKGKEESGGEGRVSPQTFKQNFSHADADARAVTGLPNSLLRQATFPLVHQTVFRVR